MPRRWHAPLFELQSLESRRFLSGNVPAVVESPAMPRIAEFDAAATPAPSTLLTKGARQKLLNHWNGPNKAELQAQLDAGRSGAFDERLLAYMKSRAGQAFFWKTSDTSEIVSFIKENLATARTIEHADDIVAHRFPEQGNSDAYDVQLPAGAINWSAQPGGTSNPEFIPGLNRQEFWPELAQAYRITGNSKYVNELIAQLASWSQQNPALADPNTWRSVAPRWSLLDTSVRAQSWAWTYQLVLSSNGWTPAANTLLLAKLQEQGDFLRRVTPFALNSNRSLIHASGLLQIAQLVPEFTGAGDWEKYARKLLFGAMDNQLHADGGHVEQSPNYAINAINDLLEAYWLDRVRGDAKAWPAERMMRLRSAMESHVQLLSPNGALAALSDAYRATAAHMFTKARIILDTESWSLAKPRLRDVWLFGTDVAEDLLESPVTPSLTDRGNSYGMAESGYYVMRSGSSANARQITFDAGPTGGGHGHFDLLNFELFGYGKPLIADPGLFQYDTSASRAYIVSTRAHNTINVDGASHLALEGARNPNVIVDQWSNDADHAQVTAHHYGYSHLAGAPVVGRSIWYDYDGTALIVDWGEATARHTYQVSFNLPGDASSVTGVQSDGSFRTKHASGNVKVAPLLRSGQTVARGDATFVSNGPPPNGTKPAYRFRVTGEGRFQVFATLVTAYGSATPPDTTAEWITTPEQGKPIVLRLTKNGQTRDITFIPPALQPPPRNLASASGAANDIAWDGASNLHIAYFDRATRSLKYTVRDKNENWSRLQTIDPNLDAGVYVSLAIDANGNPGVAYFDGNLGDLKFAKLENGAWRIRTVDSAGSVGLYPSLVFSRTNDPIITYYHRTKGDLRYATTVPDGWLITTIDGAGDAGRSGSAQADPNQPGSSRVAVAYENSTDGTYKYAVQSDVGWSIQTIDDNTSKGGGYLSLQFAPLPVAGTYRPAVSYYDSGNSALKFASFNGSTWQSETVIAAGKVGLYTSLVYDVQNRPNIFFFSKTVNKGYRGTLTSSGWVYSLLGVGGRETSVARHFAGALAYTTLDDAAPLLEARILPS
ncbi:MAG: alginate lyase family protein [Tepidisphaeraceae bacterium]